MVENGGGSFYFRSPVIMTPLKFRAWHKFHKKMFTLTSEEDIANGIAFVAEGGEDFEGWDAEDEDERPIVVMQSTGLFDKNGKEIFEGDILKSNCACADVNWFDGRFVIDVWNLSTFLQDQDAEIIGNVWENSDLLPPTK
jgi:hypothetical protein